MIHDSSSTSPAFSRTARRVSLHAKNTVSWPWIHTLCHFLRGSGCETSRNATRSLPAESESPPAPAPPARRINTRPLFYLSFQATTDEQRHPIAPSTSSLSMQRRLTRSRAPSLISRSSARSASNHDCVEESGAPGRTLLWNIKGTNLRSTVCNQTNVARRAPSLSTRFPAGASPFDSGSASHHITQVPSHRPRPLGS